MSQDHVLGPPPRTRAQMAAGDRKDERKEQSLNYLQPEVTLIPSSLLIPSPRMITQPTEVQGAGTAPPGHGEGSVNFAGKLAHPATSLCSPGFSRQEQDLPSDRLCSHRAVLGEDSNLPVTGPNSGVGQPRPLARIVSVKPWN